MARAASITVDRRIVESTRQGLAGLIPLPATWAMIRLIVITGLLTAVLVVTRGLYFPLADAFGPACVCVVLTCLAVIYQVARPAPNFVLCLKSLCVLVAFSTVYSVFMYALASTARPLADATLAASDAWLGLSAPETIAWVRARPTWDFALWLAYFSLIPQTILAIMWLGLSNDRPTLDRFLLRFFLGALMAAVGFYLLPAIGTCSAYNLPVPSHYVPIIEHLEAMRSGASNVVTWRGAQGLITFPSFHAVWAVLLAAAFWPSRYLRLPMAALNIVVVLSTIPIGMHYFTDVLVGLAISAIVIVGVRR